MVMIQLYQRHNLVWCLCNELISNSRFIGFYNKHRLVVTKIVATIQACRFATKIPGHEDVHFHIQFFLNQTQLFRIDDFRWLFFIVPLRLGG